jgi:acetyl-CoA carboxylase carboxyltransferase component
MHGRAIAAGAGGARARERLERAYANECLSAAGALAAGSVDAVIAPGETRARLLDAFAARECAIDEKPRVPAATTVAP